MSTLLIAGNENEYSENKMTRLVPKAGDWIGEFQILGRIGEGAFAEVYLARQQTAQRLVAIKIVSREDEELATLARFDHPNIVRIFDRRSLPDNQGSFLYLEYLPGGTLESVFLNTSIAGSPQNQRPAEILAAIDRNLLAANQVVPERSQLREEISGRSFQANIAWIGIQLASALDAAQRKGVLHLDVKPANVLFAADGLPKLADFNVSLDDDPGTIAERIGRGTPEYMSPEQLDALLGQGSGTTIDARSDLYSLAVVLWQAWKGCFPWDANGQNSSLSTRATVATRANADRYGQQELEKARKMREQVIPVSGRADAVDRALEITLRKALSVDPNQRFENGARFAADLRLAMHPEVINLFVPSRRSLRYWVAKWPVAMIAAMLMLLPNILAGVFNFFYNETQILSTYPSMRPAFGRLATVVNTIAYPAAVLTFLFLVRKIRTGLVDVRQSRDATEDSLKAVWYLGHRAAMVCGVFWSIAGIVYPVTLRLLHPEFALKDMLHFFLSLVICGGIAWTMPFFIGSALGLFCYYPALLRGSMRDQKFAMRRERLLRLAGRYVLAAGLIPLLAAALHAMRTDESSGILLLAIGLTASGICVAFAVYQNIERRFNQIARVIS